MPVRAVSQFHATLKSIGTPSRLGVIVATTTKNNHDTATPFSNTSDALKGKMLLVQPDTACYIVAGTTNAVTATNTGVKLEAGEKYLLSMREEYGWLACLPVAGTTNLQVYEML